jgi:hypothetical protein
MVRLVITGSAARQGWSFIGPSGGRPSTMICIDVFPNASG